jgi:hypothetical protein
MGRDTSMGGKGMFQPVCAPGAIGGGGTHGMGHIPGMGGMAIAGGGGGGTIAVAWFSRSCIIAIIFSTSITMASWQ